MNWLDPNATNPLLLFAVLAALAGAFAAVLAAVLGMWRGVRWLYRRYVAWRNERLNERRLDRATDAYLKRGAKAARHYGLLPEDMQ